MLFLYKEHVCHEIHRVIKLVAPQLGILMVTDMVDEDATYHLFDLEQFWSILNVLLMKFSAQ